MSIPVLKIKDEKGNIIPIPAIKGDKGDSYVLTDADKQEIAGMVGLPDEDIVTQEEFDNTIGELENTIEQIKSGRKTIIPSTEENIYATSNAWGEGNGTFVCTGIDDEFLKTFGYYMILFGSAGYIYLTSDEHPEKLGLTIGSNVYVEFSTNSYDVSKLEVIVDASSIWVELVNDTLTENLATEYRVVFEKPYKKIRFKIQFYGSSKTTLNQVRFKRSKSEGATEANNYLLYTSGGAISTRRFLWGTAFFDVDGLISITDGGASTGIRALGTAGGSYGGDKIYEKQDQYFPEFYFYLGGSISDDGTLTGNVIGAGSTIQVWGCE